MSRLLECAYRQRAEDVRLRDVKHLEVLDEEQGLGDDDLDIVLVVALAPAAACACAR